MDIQSIVIELEKVLSTTREFNNVKRANDIIQKNVKAQSLIAQFEKKQDLLYSPTLSQNQKQLIADELENDYQKLSSVPEIRNYFAAIEDFNQLLLNITKQLNDSLLKKL